MHSSFIRQVSPWR